MHNVGVGDAIVEGAFNLYRVMTFHSGKSTLFWIDGTYTDGFFFLRFFEYGDGLLFPREHCYREER